MAEHDAFENKSLRKITGKTADWSAIAKECVCFANGRGGVLQIGVEDGKTEPPSGQTINPMVPGKVFQRIGEITINVAPSFPEIRTAPSGGQYLSISIPPSTSLACTTDGRY